MFGADCTAHADTHCTPNFNSIMTRSSGSCRCSSVVTLSLSLFLLLTVILSSGLIHPTQAGRRKKVKKRKSRRTSTGSTGVYKQAQLSSFQAHDCCKHTHRPHRYLPVHILGLCWTLPYWKGYAVRFLALTPSTITLTCTPLPTTPGEFDGDPLASYGGIHKLPRATSATFASELATSGVVGWRKLQGQAVQQARGAGVAVSLTLPDIQWNDLVRALSAMEVLEFQVRCVATLCGAQQSNNQPTNPLPLTGLGNCRCHSATQWLV